MNRSLASALISLTLLSIGDFTAQADVRLEVRAGGHDRVNCPVVMSVPDELADSKSFTLTRESDQSEIAVQRLGWAEHPKLMWMIHDKLPAGEKRTYKLSGAASSKRNDVIVRCEDDGRRFEMTVDNTPVLHFNHATVESPDGIDPVYRRSGYFHPVFSPTGKVVTGDFEKDHPHQHGIFNAWVNTTFRDQPVDFWNQAKGKGDVEFTKLKNRRKAGSVFAQFSVELTHVAIIDGQRIPAIREICTARVLNSADPFLVDVTSRLWTASDDRVIVNKYHYGGFGFRGPSEWLLPKSQQDKPTEDPVAAAGFLTSSDRTRIDGNHTRARWVNLHGPIGTQHAGITVLDAPTNFRSPQTVRLHPTKPYFCYAPMVLGEFKLEKGDVFRSRYRLVVHDGAANKKLNERCWQDFAHPPKVNVLK